MKERFYSFNRYLREIFGERVHKISIDAGFSCPNIDGTLSRQGCIYCNNKGFSRNVRRGKSVELQIDEAAKFYQQRWGVKKFIVYFQSFTNTYADVDVLRNKYEVIKKFPQVVGIAISTRPDCIDEEKLELISQYQRDYLVWIEYGLQATDNRILKYINRNHTYEDFLRACDLTRKYKINVGVHLILGLPFSKYEDTLNDARRLVKLDIQGIKFHILHILKDTKLQEIYNKGEVNLLTKEEYINLVCDFLERIPSSFVVLRLISTAFADYLISPQWINRKEEIISKINRELAERGTYQGCFLNHKCAQIL